MRNTAHETGGKQIAVRSQFVSGVIAINLLVAFYNVLIFYNMKEWDWYYSFPPEYHITTQIIISNYTLLP
jgi:hypothetical protein